jgi:ketosteroid isomerase-like protein
VKNLDLMRAFFAGAPDDLVAAIDDPAWVEATRQALGPLLADDFEFVTVTQSVGMPGVRTGVEGFFSAYRAYAQMWESYSLKPVRFEEIGDRIVVEAKLSGRTRHGGVQLEQDVAALYTFEDGKIKRIEEFSDVASAYAASGAG